LAIEIFIVQDDVFFDNLIPVIPGDHIHAEDRRRRVNGMLLLSRVHGISFLVFEFAHQRFEFFLNSFGCVFGVIFIVPNDFIGYFL